MENKKLPLPVRILLFFCGFLMGGFYIILYFGGCAYLYTRMLGSTKEKTALLLFALLGLLGIVLFFVLSRLVANKLRAGRYAFPIGAFLVSDGALLCVFLMRLLDPQRLLAWAGGSTDLAKSYIFGMMVLIATLTVQVIAWLISVLFVAFRYFQRVNFGGPAKADTDRAALEAQLRAQIEAELRAKAAAEAPQKENEPPQPADREEPPHA